MFVSFLFGFRHLKRKQAGAELGQAQVKLSVRNEFRFEIWLIIEVVFKVRLSGGCVKKMKLILIST